MLLTYFLVEFPKDFFSPKETMKHQKKIQILEP